MRLTDLWDANVKTLDGEKLGRVHEIHAEGGRVVALTCGPGSFIERLTARKHGRRVPWEYVVRIDKGEIFVAPDPPRRTPKKKS
jgi:sporulation protein YlmC with PRC-barrel domain